ncbi:probable protein phosphatase 2C 55 [Euphorbia lathyris]|uniref:probable protein phosphatase 2C 55 n=1 Tax=Euphorbia lathyris TaxID=212925 RepID=UPI0033131F39
MIFENPQINSFHTKYSDTLNSDYRNGTTLKLTTGSFYLPKDNKARPQGEDAHFICKARNTIGIADGVGGWGSKGIDAGKYARELMTNSLTAVLNQNKGSTNPVRVLQSAYRKTHSKGSATACIIALNDNNVLRYANLGDSGFILFRWKKFLYRSPVQHHEFNCPYQLGSGSRDTPNLAYEEEIQVEDGDIIVAATDGLFDNVCPHDIEKILNRNKSDDPYKLASEIVEHALINSVDENYFSPFAKAAAAEGFKHKGGKYDDITVVVAKIELDLPK